MEYPIKVLIMDTVMDRGGSEAMTMNFMRNMDRNKVQYDFLVHRDYKGAYEDEIHLLGGNIYRICPMYPQFFGRYKREIRRFLQEHKEYKIIHSNTMELGYFAYKEANKQGVPVIISHSHTVPKGFDLKTLFRVYFKLKSRKYVTHMFACSQEAGIWLFGKHNAEKVRIIKNAIETSKYTFDEEIREKVRKDFNIKDDYFVVGHVGRFFPQKNHDFLVDIFMHIKKKQPKSILMLVGSGETGDTDKYFIKIKRKITQLGLEDSVIFTGVRSDVHELMQAMDSFVFPSKYEGFGIALVEAQAAGLRCFTSEKVVPQDVNVTNLLTYISLNSSAEYWAQKIVEHSFEQGRVGRKKEIEDAGYDIMSNAKEMEGLYSSLLE